MNKTIFYTILKKFFKDSITKLLASGSLSQFIFAYMSAKTFDSLVKPFLDLAIRKGMLKVDEHKGKIIVHNIHKATKEKNYEKYREAINRIR